jgi:hypothetical protein
MKAMAISLVALTALAACNRQSEEQVVENFTRATLASQGNVQQLDLTKGADNNYSGFATVSRAGGQIIRLNCTARRNQTQGEFDIRCGQVIDQVLLDELEGSMRHSLEQQGLTVAQIDLNRQDDDHVAGSAEVSDPNTGESARLACTGARSNGGRIEARCDVPGGPAQNAGAAPATGQPAADEEAAPAEDEEPAGEGGQ